MASLVRFITKGRSMNIHAITIERSIMSIACRVNNRNILGGCALRLLRARARVVLNGARFGYYRCCALVYAIKVRSGRETTHKTDKEEGGDWRTRQVNVNLGPGEEFAGQLVQLHSLYFVLGYYYHLELT